MQQYPIVEKIPKGYLARSTTHFGKKNLLNCGFIPLSMQSIRRSTIIPEKKNSIRKPMKQSRGRNAIFYFHLLY